MASGVKGKEDAGMAEDVELEERISESSMNWANGSKSWAMRESKDVEFEERISGSSTNWANGSKSWAMSESKDVSLEKRVSVSVG